jgi:hypothetical protein
MQHLQFLPASGFIKEEFIIPARKNYAMMDYLFCPGMSVPNRGKTSNTTDQNPQC